MLFAFKVSANDKEAPPDLYIQLPTLLISVIQTREIKIIYKLILFIELFDPKKGQDIVFLMPKIVHAVRTDLYGLLGIVWHPSFRMNVSDLKTRLLTTIEKVVGKKANYDQIGNQLGDVPHTYADITKAKRDLDYSPKVKLEEGLRLMYLNL